MPQEPITHHFNLRTDSGKQDFVDVIMPDRKLAENRKKVKGSPEFKAFADDEQNEHIKRLNSEWLRAAFANDTTHMWRLQQKFDQQARQMVNDGTMSLIEYKNLSPWVEGTNANGGYNAPPAYVANLARNLAKYAICRNHFRIQAMKSWKENIPYLLTKPSVAAVAENAVIAATKPTEGNLLLTAYKAAGLFAASNEELEDANIPVWAVVQETFWEQFGIIEDTNGLQDLSGSFGPGALYYGDGALASNGGVCANGAIGVWRGGATNSGKTGFPQIGDAAAAKDCWGDLLYMLQVLPSGYYQGGKFFIDQQVAIAMFSLRDSQNRFIADIVNGITVEMGLDGQPKTFFKGYEIVIVPSGIMLNANTTAYDASAHPSTPFTFFCSPQKAWLTMGQRGGFRVENLREGTLDSISLATNDLQALRMVERFAYGCAQPATMVVLRTSAT